MAMPRVEIAAVNSRGYFKPRVPGAQWGNGAMGNAKWLGVRLKDVLDKAGVKAGAERVRFGGLDQPVVASAPKSTICRNVLFIDGRLVDVDHLVNDAVPAPPAQSRLVENHL
jgi:hypothetical protein